MNIHRSKHPWIKIAVALAIGGYLPNDSMGGNDHSPSFNAPSTSSPSNSTLSNSTLSNSTLSNSIHLNASARSLPSFKIRSKKTPPKMQSEGQMGTVTPTNDARTTENTDLVIFPAPLDTRITKRTFNMSAPTPEPSLDPADALHKFAVQTVTTQAIQGARQPPGSNPLPPGSASQPKDGKIVTSNVGSGMDRPRAETTQMAVIRNRSTASQKPESQKNREVIKATVSFNARASTPASPITGSASGPAKIAPVSSTQEIHPTANTTPSIQPWVTPPPVKDHSRLPNVSPQQLAKLRLPKEIDQRTRGMIKQGTSLAKRGAMFSARQEFLAVLQLVAQSYDSQLGVRYHSKALANGLQALEEADDFATRNAEAAVDFDLQAFIAGHKTPVLKGHAADELLPYVAMQRYYDYARQQLAIAGRGSSAASAAMYAIGRTETLVSQSNKSQGAGPKPLAYYQAALAIDQRNNPAANELGVMLARAGKVTEAHNVLATAASVRPTRTLMNNLAQTRRMMNGSPVSTRPPVTVDQISPQMLARRVPVKWVSPSEFGRGAGPAGKLWSQETRIANRPAAPRPGIPAPPTRFRR